ncbi:MAG TPA: ribonuclease HI [Thermoplasmata archaeon]|nr:ribonuclease HI [Thermoplasmata archaeon]
MQLPSHRTPEREHASARERSAKTVMGEPVDLRIPRGVASPDLTTPVLVRFDGSCQPPGGGGVAGWGFVIEGPGVRFEDCGLAARPYSPHSTNNVAEYVGAIRALEQLRSMGYTGEVIVEGDSQLVVRQMKGEYEVRAEHLKAYHDWLTQLARSFQGVEFRWIPRGENTVADALSKRAVESAWDDAKRHRPVRPAAVVETEMETDPG